MLYLFELPRRTARSIARGVALAEWLGLEAERRREGTALIDGDFEPLSDVRFPAARPWTRQVALLLAERICQRVRGGQPRMSVRGPGLRLRARCASAGATHCAARNRRRWPRAASRSSRRCGSCAARARDVLPLAAIARFNHVDMTAAQQRLEAA